MRVLMLEAPQALLDERRSRGADRRDEMWDGVLHLQPLLDSAHQELAMKFLLRTAPLAEVAALEGRYHPGLFRADDDYRVPDQAYFRSELASERGLEGADLVVEVRRSWDETYEKLDFYARVGVQEVLVLSWDGGSARI
jgi:Uma2 family endonuclease